MTEKRDRNILHCMSVDLSLAGFTIVEILFVVVVMAIIAAVVIPRLGKDALFDKFTVYTTAHQISADLRLARRLAVTKGINYRLDCAKTGGSSDYNQYGIYKKNNGGWDLVGQAKNIPDEIKVKGSKNVTFKPTGAANNNRTFRYEIGSYKYRAIVKKETGRVKLEAY